MICNRHLELLQAIVDFGSGQQFANLQNEYQATN